jgi:hypothetical protein
MALNEEMNKRDMFASQALAGGLQQGATSDADDWTGGDDARYWYSPRTLAKRAYEIADAMMEESDS